MRVRNREEKKKGKLLKTNEKVFLQPISTNLPQKHIRKSKGDCANMNGLAVGNKDTDMDMDTEASKLPATSASLSTIVIEILSLGKVAIHPDNAHTGY